MENPEKFQEFSLKSSAVGGDDDDVPVLCILYRYCVSSSTRMNEMLEISTNFMPATFVIVSNIIQENAKTMNECFRANYLSYFN